jgi:phenylacetate-CoA ligase
VAVVRKKSVAGRRPAGELFDSNESVAWGRRNAALLTGAAELVNSAWRRSPALKDRLERAGLAAGKVKPGALARLAPIRKRDLPVLQGAGDDPFGGLLTRGRETLQYLFVSPGPIHDPGLRGRDPWGMAHAFFAAGFRKGEIAQVTFSYHFSPAGLMFDRALVSLGCAVVPAGPGNTEQQVAAMRRLGVTAYTGTTSFLKIIVEKASEMGYRFPGDFSLTRALVAGDGLSKEDRESLAQRGIAVRQAYVTADVGAIAYECAQGRGLHVHPDALVEVCDPVTGEPLPMGEVGEIVVTKLNAVYPLVRFGTGDLSRFLEGNCACGRKTPLLAGILGRADQVTKVRGVFIHPHQVKEAAGALPPDTPVRLVVQRNRGLDSLLLLVGMRGTLEKGIEERIVSRFREITGLRVAVSAVVPAEIPSDGKVIEDRRSFTGADSGE